MDWIHGLSTVVYISSVRSTAIFEPFLVTPKSDAEQRSYLKTVTIGRRSRSPLTARVPVGPRSMWLGLVVPGSFRRGPRPAAPVGSAACGAVRRCAEQLLPGSAPWPAVPHRGLRSRRCRAQRTIGDRPCVVTDGVVFSRSSPSRPMVVPN